MCHLKVIFTAINLQIADISGKRGYSEAEHLIYFIS
jgi:hypothetical protein